MEERRKRIRERHQLLFPEQEDLLAREDDDQDLMDQVESEYDAESEDQQTTALVLATPVGFVPKSQRDTFAELQPLEEEEKRFEELAKKRLECRKDETRRMVVELISREELHEADNPDLNEANSDSADDDFNEAAVEYEAWKRCEIARIKRDREGNESNMASSRLAHDTTGKSKVAVCPIVRRVLSIGHTAKPYFAVCFFWHTAK